MIVLYILFLIVTWVLGYYEGDATVALIVSVCGILYFTDKAKERQKRRTGKKAQIISNVPLAYREENTRKCS